MAKERKREQESERDRRSEPPARTDAPAPDSAEQSRGGKKRERKFGHN
ncbi:hypothetical protein SAMN06297387_101247 [Streptomyces zhaozhouensis]|uniref:Uncharacterized protein n=1 Tax=Streptomyces zhaozhouensis TaxID=1300267 RepID=A0A286DIS5_9ACTN|nr:hypothetical protein [Streptomyces zhaozhouensis]SOD58635.1 hypothetical protein SAMN06297387_101247 [Streptomyces zhaozhouensis]